MQNKHARNTIDSQYYAVLTSRNISHTTFIIQVAERISCNLKVTSIWGAYGTFWDKGYFCGYLQGLIILASDLLIWID